MNSCTCQSAAAKKAAESIALEIGYTAKVDRLAIYADEFNEHFDDIEEIITLNDVINNVDVIDCEEVWSSAENTGESLDPESIVVTYRHHKYIGYAYQVLSIDFVKYTNLRTEADLIQDADSVMAHYYAHFENINDLEDSFAWNERVPFNKLNSGSALVQRFLEENGHPNYI